MYEKADNVVRTLSLEQKIGQMLMVALPGTEMNPAVEKILENYLPGGVIYFGYNLTDDRGITRFSEDIQKKSMQSAGIPVFVSVDQEGGRVVRIISGVTQFPGNMAAGAAGDGELVFRWARVLGIEMRRLGVNMNLAPVLDVNNNPENPVINTRSFGSDPGLVADMGKEYIHGLQESRCIAVGKHFPGHGDTDKDSHLTLPVIRYTMDRLKQVELYPFRRAIDAGVECIMTAHIAFPQIVGNNESATISRFFLTELLRKEMGFEGIVMTDDMEMNAIAGEMDMGEAAVRSVKAGTDIILISSYGDNAGRIYGSLLNAVKKGDIDEKRIDDSVRRIIEVKLRYSILGFNENENRIILPPAKENEKDEKILSGAGEVNIELSRNAISYYGDEKLLRPGKNSLRVFISDNADLKNSIIKEGNEIFPASVAELKSALGRTNREERDIIVYYEFYKPDFRSLRSLREIVRDRGLGCVIVCSGDPFPVMRSGLFDSFLLSFSNTPLSMKMLAECLNGAFVPGKRASLIPGLPGRQ